MIYKTVTLSPATRLRMHDAENMAYISGDAERLIFHLNETVLILGPGRILPTPNMQVYIENPHCRTVEVTLGFNLPPESQIADFGAEYKNVGFHQFTLGQFTPVPPAGAHSAFVFLREDADTRLNLRSPNRMTVRALPNWTAAHMAAMPASFQSTRAYGEVVPCHAASGDLLSGAHYAAGSYTADEMAAWAAAVGEDTGDYGAGRLYGVDASSHFLELPAGLGVIVHHFNPNADWSVEIEAVDYGRRA